MRIKQRLLRRCTSAWTVGQTLTISAIISCILLYSFKSAQNPNSQDELDDDDVLPSCEDLSSRISELQRIRRSVRTELRSLEKERGIMQTKINELGRKIESLKSEAARESTELSRLKVSLRTSQIARKEFVERNTPEIRAPFRLKAFNLEVYTPPRETCRTMSECFDYSRCSLTSGFPLFFYDKPSGNPEEACLFVAKISSPYRDISQLPYWNGDGRNHLIILTGPPDIKLSRSRALIATQFHLKDKSFRPKFDISTPLPLELSVDDLSDLVPLRREYLVSYFGEPDNEDSLYKYVKLIGSDQTDDRSFFSKKYTLDNLSKSTFAIVDPSKENFQTFLLDCLVQGAIPVIAFPEKFHTILPELVLPFAEVLDWKLASIVLNYQRIPELHFLLRSYPDSDLFYLKRQGRLILTNYYSNPLMTAINVVRERIGLPSKEYPETPSPSVFNDTFKKRTMDQLPPDFEPGESLGPLEPPFPSNSHRRNFSSLALHRYMTWNEIFKPFWSTPFTPWEPLLPTEARFLGSSGFRPIGEGQGGTGLEFGEAIGGNFVNEQFTIVVLTYERDQVLMNSLSRLYGLPYLNKVIVVWNSPNPPAEDLEWPDIGVEILVIKAPRNSLNNRFLPYEAIETEAVLSIDDDAHLRHDEIVFGFRVWRENRDRLVGFPGRFHAWDSLHKSWNYNSNYSCELSMVLTGAAFYHKYYGYLYTYEMPQSIRDKVDEFMNCEDLAMNFLVSHVTRKPPVKVTSRWTFRCPGCPVSLSEDDSHFQERHKCINYFKAVYGYMPLLYTQFRADSVLFKTRIPQDKQKCFKFI